MASSQYRVYLDACCLNRPFDNQTQDRFRLESEAVILILNRCQTDEWILINSIALEAEIAQTPNPERREQVMTMLQLGKEKIGLTDGIKERIIQLVQLGFSPSDAAHVASAEATNADVLLTTDDRLLQRATRYQGQMRVRLANPVQWLITMMPNKVEGNDDAK